MKRIKIGIVLSIIVLLSMLFFPYNQVKAETSLNLGLLLYRKQDANGNRNRLCNRWTNRNNK